MWAAFILSLGPTSPFPIRSFHKKFCTQNSTSTSKLVYTLVANPFINLYLQIALACAFQLDKNRNTSQPLIGRCDVIVRPSNGLFFIDLAIGKIATQDIFPTEGMIQLRNFVPIHPDLKIPEMATWIPLWENAKARMMNSVLANSNTLVGIVDFVMEDMKQTLTLAIPILEAAIDSVESGEPFYRESARTGIRTKIALSSDECLQ